MAVEIGYFAGAADSMGFIGGRPCSILHDELNRDVESQLVDDFLVVERGIVTGSLSAVQFYYAQGLQASPLPAYAKSGMTVYLFTKDGPFHVKSSSAYTRDEYLYDLFTNRTPEELTACIKDIESVHPVLK